MEVIACVRMGTRHPGGWVSPSPCHVGEEEGVGFVGDFLHATVVVQAGVRRGAGDEELGAEGGGELLARIVVNQARGFVEAVGHGLEKDGDGGDLLVIRLEPVAQVSSVGQVEAHDPVVGLEQARVHLKSGSTVYSHTRAHTFFALDDSRLDPRGKRRAIYWSLTASNRRVKGRLTVKGEKTQKKKGKKKKRPRLEVGG